ncbi:hypothetical protein V6N12_006961 [Hibiscus sabdariffa]|uniref:Protein arginine N-methyltransferase domain-containing protein n=1 Tax=Hibiscus sabdariffa TaxID=183260 RepID=A0ABR2F0F4_9ROSI
MLGSLLLQCGGLSLPCNAYVSAMMQLAKQCGFEEPCVETITGENVMTWPHVVKHVDCYTIQLHELESVSTRYKFQSMVGPASSTNNHTQSSLIGTSNNNPVDGFPRKKRANPNEAPVRSTAPEDPPTHWQQTLIYFYDPIEVEQDQISEGFLTRSQSKENRRFMNIHLDYSVLLLSTEALQTDHMARLPCLKLSSSSACPMKAKPGPSVLSLSLDTKIHTAPVVCGLLVAHVET